MNGAGSGGRLVARRDRATGRAENTGRSQLGNRRQRYGDIRSAFGLSTGQYYDHNAIIAKQHSESP